MWINEERTFFKDGGKREEWWIYIDFEEPKEVRMEIIQSIVIRLERQSESENKNGREILYYR